MTILEKIKAYKRRYLSVPRHTLEVVNMIDGTIKHGGLTDCFRNILSLYSWCKLYDLPFRIHYTYPCRLEEFLLPNQYDWRIKTSEISIKLMQFFYRARWDKWIQHKIQILI